MTGTFEGLTTLQFSPDNKFAYGYSGVITDPASSSAASTALLFTTQSEYLEAKLTLTTDEASTAAAFVECFFNDIKIMRLVADSGSLNNPMITPYDMLIPPFTKFELKVGANATMDFTAWITAKVHGAIEQENLEAITDNNKWASK